MSTGGLGSSVFFAASHMASSSEEWGVGAASGSEEEWGVESAAPVPASSSEEEDWATGRRRMFLTTGPDRGQPDDRAGLLRDCPDRPGPTGANLDRPGPARAAPSTTAAGRRGEEAGQPHWQGREPEQAAAGVRSKAPPPERGRREPRGRRAEPGPAAAAGERSRAPPPERPGGRGRSQEGERSRAPPPERRDGAHRAQTAAAEGGTTGRRRHRSAARAHHSGSSAPARSPRSPSAAEARAQRKTGSLNGIGDNGIGDAKLGPAGRRWGDSLCKKMSPASIAMATQQ